MKIGIIGNGFVGKATKQLKCSDIEILAYDINPEICEPCLKLSDTMSVKLFLLVYQHQ